MDVRQYIPKNLRELQLWDKVGDVVQHIVDEREAEFEDFLSKYTDVAKQSKEALSATLRELGYSYVIDILDLTKASLENIVVLGGLIHVLKGSRPGVDLVMKLLDISYAIEEWWENPAQNNPPQTFRLLINLDMTNIKVDTYVRLKDFIESYVYPVSKMESSSTGQTLLTFLSGGFYDKAFDAASLHPVGFYVSGVADATFVSAPIG